MLVRRMKSVLLLPVFLLGLQACNPAYLNEPLECSEIRQLCFRGVQLDPAETRARFGGKGHRAILDYTTNFNR